MTLARLIFLLVLLGGPTLFLLQNQSPSIALVFWGVRSRPLPLSIWLGMAMISGSLFSLALAALFQLSNYLAIRRWRKGRQATKDEPDSDDNDFEDELDDAEDEPEPEPPRSQAATARPPQRASNIPEAFAGDYFPEDRQERDRDWLDENAPPRSSTTRRPSGSTRFEPSPPAAESSEDSEDDDEVLRSPEPPEGSEVIDAEPVPSTARPPKTERNRRLRWPGQRQRSTTSAERSSRIYDADYKVIISPSRSPAAEEVAQDIFAPEPDRSRSSRSPDREEWDDW